VGMISVVTRDSRLQVQSSSPRHGSFSPEWIKDGGTELRCSERCPQNGPRTACSWIISAEQAFWNYPRLPLSYKLPMAAARAIANFSRDPAAK
jgi:hypothetical protein